MKLWKHTSGSGPELVLLHGWGMNAGVWEPLLPDLETRFRVTRIELPGHGESPSLSGGLRAWAEACLAVAPADAFWVGWSLGGTVVQQVALMASERVSRIGLVTATPSFVRRSDWLPAMQPEVFQQFAQALETDSAGTLKRFLGLQVKGVPGARELLRSLDAALARRPSPDPAGLQLGLQILLDTDLRDGLAALQIPSHWLFGERDTLVPVAVAGEIAALAPNAVCELIANAGHAPFLSHPGQCLDWLVRNHG